MSETATPSPYAVGTVISIPDEDGDPRDYLVAGRYGMGGHQYAMLTPVDEEVILTRVEGANLEQIKDETEMRSLMALIEEEEEDVDASLNAKTLTLEAFQELAKRKHQEYFAIFAMLGDDGEGSISDPARLQIIRDQGGAIARRHIPHAWLQATLILAEEGYGLADAPNEGDDRWFVPLRVWELAMKVYAEEGGT